LTSRLIAAIRVCHLHILTTRDADGGEHGLWRISMESIDAWTLRKTLGGRAEAAEEKGPFARLPGTP
jgi:hypothetical protein